MSAENKTSRTFVCGDPIDYHRLLEKHFEFCSEIEEVTEFLCKFTNRFTDIITFFDYDRILMFQLSDKAYATLQSAKVKYLNYRSFGKYPGISSKCSCVDNVVETSYLARGGLWYPLICPGIAEQNEVCRAARQDGDIASYNEYSGLPDMSDVVGYTVEIAIGKPDEGLYHWDADDFCKFIGSGGGCEIILGAGGMKHTL